MTNNQIASLIGFARRIIEDMSFNAKDLDGGDIQDIAERLGLLIKTKYDPAIHGPTDICDDGDDWYVFAPFLENAE